jgi:NAD(P)-dependent dehydrogenase (short-subunit alcohol dehydrogenase family)
MGTYVVTGATSGIGAATARLLADRGEELVLVVRDREKAAAAFPGSVILETDLQDLELIHDLGVPDRIDGVVHAAGVVDVALLDDTEPESLVRTIEVNLTAPVLLTQVLLEPVRRARGTHVFVNSGSGLRANAQWASYNASKFGLRGFADALRLEEAEHGVRVSTIYPGRTATPMQERVHEQEGAAAYDADDWIRPETVATEIVRVLDLGPDATIPDLVIRPR